MNTLDNIKDKIEEKISNSLETSYIKSSSLCRVRGCLPLKQYKNSTNGNGETKYNLVTNNCYDFLI